MYGGGMQPRQRIRVTSAGGVVYRSFKMCMACTTPDGLCRTCPNPLGESTRAGIFLTEVGPAQLTAEEVAAWMQTRKRQLNVQLPR